MKEEKIRRHKGDKSILMARCLGSMIKPVCYEPEQYYLNSISSRTESTGGRCNRVICVSRPSGPSNLCGPAERSTTEQAVWTGGAVHECKAHRRIQASWIIIFASKETVRLYCAKPLCGRWGWQNEPLPKSRTSIKKRGPGHCWLNLFGGLSSGVNIIESLILDPLCDIVCPAS